MTFPSTKSRYRSLDLLRGLMAVSIMIYHLNEGESGSTLGRLGIYAVCIFFVLSGLSMAIAYDRFITDARTAGAFYVRRIFRIWPLFWVAVSLAALASWHGGKPFSAGKLLLNYTTLFGFVAPYSYVNEGAWSIGNEMVYYALTPLLLAGFRYRRWAGGCIMAATIALGALFALRWMNPAAPIESQFDVYVNPFNNLYFYCSGLMLYYGLRDTKPGKQWCVGMLAVSAAVFVFYPLTGNQIYLAVGLPRLVFSVISVVTVYAVWKLGNVMPGVIGDKLEQLGVATYGIYLLHPIAMGWIASVLKRLRIGGPVLFQVLVVSVTIAGSLLLYRYYEYPFMQLGKRLAPGKKAAAVALKGQALAVPAGGSES
jgi:peptidoglycan/LPS O-acetylase OafA/YrhL